MGSAKGGLMLIDRIRSRVPPGLLMKVLGTGTRAEILNSKVFRV